MNKIREMGQSATTIHQPALERIHNDIRATEDSLRDALSRLWSVHERLSGPTPTDPCSAGEPQPPDLIGRLDASVHSLRGIADALHTLATELEQVA